jgi:hypothetical protein
MVRSAARISASLNFPRLSSAVDIIYRDFERCSKYPLSVAQT